jgi:peptidyl-prolyl cis-trans isomerase A (cyclophilin A)
MVTIQRPSPQSPLPFRAVLCVAIVFGLLFLVVFESDPDAARLRQQGAHGPKPLVVSLVPANAEVPKEEHLSEGGCPYLSLLDLTESELYPAKGKRHMVNPPSGGQKTLVCCQTTQGPWNILVHHKWAPEGARRFVEMVEKDYFSATVPLMRCLKNFLCQFGLSGDPILTKEYRKNLPDDLNWLPQGPLFKENEDGVKRFAKGYLAYAGAGPNSRGNQFIVGLQANGPLSGGSPWEVPWGELVGAHSFESLDKVYTGYGEKGPTQGRLGREGVTDGMREEFPKLDYVTACEVIDEMDDQ